MTKILLVSQCQKRREQLGRQLQTQAYEVLTAANGFTAVTTAQVEQPALILVDTRLPGIHGWQMADLLKSSAYTRHIPIIAMAKQHLKEDIPRCMAAGCNAAVTVAESSQWPQLLTQIEALLPAGKM